MESFKYCMEIQSNELNSSDQLRDCLFKPNWESSMDQADPFESALSSIVSSPVAATSNAGAGDGVMIRELIGRLGNICNSGEISPQSYMCSNSNSTNTSCYGTPLNSPPKLNLSMADPQIRASFQIPGAHLPTSPSLAPFSGDPGFAERAAKFSCFGSRNFGGLSGQFGVNETELPFRSSMPRIESIDRARQALSVGGSQMVGGHESNKVSLTQNGNSGSDKRTNRVSRSSTPENGGEFGESREGSSVSDQIPSGEMSGKLEVEANARKRKAVPRGKAKETPSSSPSVKDAKAAVEIDESNAKRSKKDGATGNEKDGATKTKAETEGGKGSGEGNQKQTKENSKPPEPPKDYIHVRARRGQATDSHSLAERVRREKISERMKFLQDLVPGCNKVTGKAVMLDEIINYVQSLQRQVEFLSMKLATVNPRMDFNMEALLSKEIFQSRGSLPHALYPLDSSSMPAAFQFGYNPQQVPQLHNGISTASETQFPVNPLNGSMHRAPSMQLPAIDGFAEPPPQGSTFFEDDLQSVVQMGFGQIQQQGIQGSMTAAQMKVEL